MFIAATLAINLWRTITIFNFLTYFLRRTRHRRWNHTRLRLITYFFRRTNNRKRTLFTLLTYWAINLSRLFTYFLGANWLFTYTTVIYKSRTFDFLSGFQCLPSLSQFFSKLLLLLSALLICLFKCVDIGTDLVNLFLIFKARIVLIERGWLTRFL